MKSLNVDIAEEQHRRLKLRAVLLGISIRDFVKQAIETQLKITEPKTGETNNEKSIEQ